MEARAFGDSGSRVVIEEFLTGPEVSVLAFTDGTAIAPMAVSYTHLRRGTGDPMLNKARIAVLVSGGGTNLEALLNAQEAGALPHVEIVLFLSSNPEAYALERAKRRGVPAIPPVSYTHLDVYKRQVPTPAASACPGRVSWQRSWGSAARSCGTFWPLWSGRASSPAATELAPSSTAMC